MIDVSQTSDIPQPPADLQPDTPDLAQRACMQSAPYPTEDVAAMSPASTPSSDVVFTGHDWLLVALAVVEAAGWVVLLDVQAVVDSLSLPGFGATLFSLGSFALSLVALGRRPQLTMSTVFLGVACLLLALLATLTGNSSLRFLDCLILWGTQTYLTFLVAGLWPACWAQATALGHAICFFFVSAMRNWTLPPRALGSLCKRLERNGAHAPSGVGIGILAALIVLAIVIPLLCSADVVFSSLFTQLGDAIAHISLPGFTWRVIYALLIAPLMFGLLWALAHTMPGRSAAESGSEGTKLRVATMAVVLAALDIVYLVFVIVQFVYLFGGQDSVAMAGGYAAYARSGFFQLAFVAFINMCTSLLAVRARASEGESGVFWLRVLNVVLIVLTAVILVSAVKRMMLYTDAYGLSLLRMLTMLGMVLCAVLLVVLLIKTFREQTGFFRILVVAGLALWIVFCLMNPDAIIANDAVSRYEAGTLDSVDVEYLGYELSYDTHEALLRYQELLAADPDAAESDLLEVQQALNHQQQVRDDEPWQMWCTACL